MRYTKYILLTVILIGCRTDSEKSENEATEANKKAIESLLTKLKQLSMDTVEVHSTDELEDVSFPFRGTKLDSFEISVLPDKRKDVHGHGLDFYGCYKFPIDSIHTGIIVRTPSEYVSSSIKLFVLENSSKQILEPSLELAESTGDAGFSLTKTSFILKGNEKVNYLVWRHEGEDMSVEDENDTTIQTWDYLHLLTFKRGTFDTLDSDMDRLMEAYTRLKKLPK